LMALTNEQTLWLQGFYAYCEGQERPTKSGPKQRGWDMAESMASKGGYGR